MARMQLPFTQIEPDAHAVSQRPQCAALIIKSTQVPLHETSEPLHAWPSASAVASDAPTSVCEPLLHADIQASSANGTQALRKKAMSMGDATTRAPVVNPRDAR